jgi:LPPG:FO 2-phospho-L-lactate transferase
MLVALAGGVGASKFLRGLVGVWDPEDLTVIVNTGDDIRIHGLYVSPDLDSVIYRLAGVGDDERGWGRADETWNVLNTLVSLGEPGWYGLGDRDIAAQLFKKRLMTAGLSLSEATTELCKRFGISSTIIPMTDDIVETRIEVALPMRGAEEIGFQEYWVERKARDRVKAIRFRGIDSARAAPGIVDAIRDASAVILCPSNPAVSISPILAVPLIRETVMAARCPKISVTPIIAGAPVLGMADKLLPAWGIEVSARGVAKLYAEFIDYFVLDEADAIQADEIAALGVEPVVARTLMNSPSAERALARAVVDVLFARH